MREAFLIVSVILFIIDGLVYWTAQGAAYGGRLQSVGLAFFAASFMGFLPG